jgi:hypothetical protein
MMFMMLFPLAAVNCGESYQAYELPKFIVDGHRHYELVGQLIM